MLRSWFARKRELLWLIIPAVMLTLGVFWFAYQFVEPAPPTSAVIATGGKSGAYYAFGKQYSKIFDRVGIDLKVKSTAGSIENLGLISDPNSGVDLALLQGGITSSQLNPDLMSLGRVFLEPIWVFYRSSDDIEYLSSLQGKRIAVGPEGSGTRKLSIDLLKANDVLETNATILPLGGKSAVDAMLSDKVDAIFLVTSPKSPLIKSLISNSSIKLMNFVQAEAYTRIYPYLTKVVLPQGVFDLVKKQPKTDISMVAASAALVARKTLHPTIVGLMANAALKTHSRGGLFQKDGEFPKSIDPELPMSDDAKRIYKSGPPFLYRFLPFWLASFLQRSFILMLPIMTVLIPVVKGVPWLYTWRIRNKLLRWYSDIKRLERKIRLENKLDYQANKQEVERIETAASKITVPVGLSDHYYDLRREIDLVHQMLIDNKQS